MTNSQQKLLVGKWPALFLFASAYLLTACEGIEALDKKGNTLAQSTSSELFPPVGFLLDFWELKNPFKDPGSFSVLFLKEDGTFWRKTKGSIIKEGIYQIEESHVLRFWTPASPQEMGDADPLYTHILETYSYSFDGSWLELKATEIRKVVLLESDQTYWPTSKQPTNSDLVFTMEKLKERGSTPNFGRYSDGKGSCLSLSKYGFFLTWSGEYTCEIGSSQEQEDNNPSSLRLIMNAGDLFYPDLFAAFDENFQTVTLTLKGLSQKISLQRTSSACCADNGLSEQPKSETSPM